MRINLGYKTENEVKYYIYLEHKHKNCVSLYSALY